MTEHNKWISVDDKLPQEKLDVVLCDIDKNICIGRLIEDIDTRLKFIAEDDDMYYEVVATHWMILDPPDCYKEN